MILQPLTGQQHQAHTVYKMARPGSFPPASFLLEFVKLSRMAEQILTRSAFFHD